MKVTHRQPSKKPYEKPLVTRVKLKVETNVLAGCHANLGNMSGYDEFDCFESFACEKSPTL